MVRSVFFGGSAETLPKGQLALVVVVAALLPALSLAAPIKTQGTWYGSNGWDGTLRGRDAAGNPINLLNSDGTAPNPALQYVYDTVLDLTWLANWNAGAGSSFDNFSNSTDGAMTWANANAWAASLMDFGGGWVLPKLKDIGNDGCQLFTNAGGDCGYNVYGSEAGRRESQLAHMYYDTLGNRGYSSPVGVFQPDFGLKNTGPFSNMLSSNYWFGTAYAPSFASDAWDFNTDYGDQGGHSQSGGGFAVAVRRGDVFAGSVPEPGGLALMGLAFGTLAVGRLRGRGVQPGNPRL
jgi:hypothetical protein